MDTFVQLILILLIVKTIQNILIVTSYLLVGFHIIRWSPATRSCHLSWHSLGTSWT